MRNEQQNNSPHAETGHHRGIPAKLGGIKRRILLAMGLAALVAISLATASILDDLDDTADRIIEDQAERTSLAWANYIGAELDQIEAIASGRKLTEEERNLLDGMRRFGEVFRFKLFSSEGRIRLNSDDLEFKDAGAADLGEHNINAASVVATGIPHTEIASGVDKPDRPDVYVESYVPVVRNGETVAIVEVYVDQTSQAAIIKTDFTWFGAQIAVLTLLALCVPFVALGLSARNMRDQNIVLEFERNKAFAAERSKSEFLANMSHELRTPLNAIIGFSDMIIVEAFGPVGNPRYVAYVKDINSSGNHLLELISDILDLSKIEAGKLELQEENVDVSRVIRSSMTLVGQRAEEQGVTIERDIAPNLSGLYADKRQLKQILINLLSNAIKFTLAGGLVTVRIWHSTDDGYVFQIADTGIGIASEDIPKALTPFRQIDSNLNRKFDGTGLGLPLTKSLIELHGGSLDLQSEVGVGTTVAVRFPAERIVSPAASAA